MHDCFTFPIFAQYLFNICTYICTIFALLISKREIAAEFPIMKSIKIFLKGKGKFQIKGEGQYDIPQKVKCRCTFPKQRRNAMRNFNRRRCKYCSKLEQHLAYCSAPPWSTTVNKVLLQLCAVLAPPPVEVPPLFGKIAATLHLLWYIVSSLPLNLELSLPFWEYFNALHDWEPCSNFSLSY